MFKANRRQFLQFLGAVAALPRPGREALESAAGIGQTSPRTPPFDLIIKSGKVVDSSQRLSSVMDVAIKGDRIASVAADIPATEARGVFDAAGKIVTAGLIDSHGHVYDSGITTSIDPDVVGFPRGVTTIIDGGSAGAANFAGFRKHVIDRAQTRIYALLNIGVNGCCRNEIYGDPRLVDTNAAISTIEQHRPIILGIKVRINGRREDLAHDVEVMKKARDVADRTSLPIMMHWSNEPDLIALLKSGDILTHPYNPPSPNSSNLVGGEPGRILPIVFTLKQRGIYTDFSHGGHLAWGVAEAAAKEGWFPDLLSTDIHRGHVPPNGVVYDLTTTISKFLYLGLSLEQAVEKVTATPAKVFRFPEPLGTLAPGSVADVTVSEVRSGEFTYFDTRRERRIGHQKLVPMATIKAGTVLYWES